MIYEEVSWISPSGSSRNARQWTLDRISARPAGSSQPSLRHLTMHTEAAEIAGEIADEVIEQKCRLPALPAARLTGRPARLAVPEDGASGVGPGLWVSSHANDDFFHHAPYREHAGTAAACHFDGTGAPVTGNEGPTACEGS
jgi:hypothetical protein